jgi:acetyltransferase-like isoleucine patch superfamily enzyme
VLGKLLFVLRQRLRGSRISPAAQIKAPSRIQLGVRCKIHRGADIDAAHGPGIRFADRVSIGRGALLQGSRGGIVIGAGTQVNNYAVINGAGGVAIGDDVLIGPHACIISYAHQYDRRDRLIREQGYRNASVRIGNDAWIGAHAVVLAGVSVGEGAVIGAGCVVTRDVPPWAVMGGVPARLLRWRGGQPPP